MADAMSSMTIGTPDYANFVGQRYAPSYTLDETGYRAGDDPLGILSGIPMFPSGEGSGVGPDFSKSPFFGNSGGEGSQWTPDYSKIGNYAINDKGITPQNVVDKVWGQGGGAYVQGNQIFYPTPKASWEDSLGGFAPLAAIALMAYGAGQFPGINPGDLSGFLNPEATNLIAQTGSNLGTEAASLGAGTTGSLAETAGTLMPAAQAPVPEFGSTVSYGTSASGFPTTEITAPGFNAAEAAGSFAGPSMLPPGAEQVPAPVQDLSKPFTPGPLLPNSGNALAFLANQFGASPNFAGALGNSVGGILGGGGPFSSALNIGSGIYGLIQSQRMKRLAEEAFRAQDPFGSQRGQYQQQLAALMSDPNYLTKLPGYQFGLDEGRRAIERRGSASGSGGNEAIALARYTPEYAMNFRNQELARLMSLSGAGISPSGGNALLQGNALASDLASRSLASIGWGAARF